MKHKFVYCSNCNHFYFRTAMNFEDGNQCCPNWGCASPRIIHFETDSFSEMAKIERQHEIRKPRRHMKYRFIYCNKCQDFYLNTSHDFGDGKDACPKYGCFSKDIVKFEADSFQEMAQIERKYKIERLKDKR